MAAAATILPSPLKPAPVPIAPSTSTVRRPSASTGSRKRSYVETVGSARERPYVNLAVETPPVNPGLVRTATPASAAARPATENANMDKAVGTAPSANVDSPPAPVSETYYCIGTTADVEPILLKNSHLDAPTPDSKIRRLDRNGTFARVDKATLVEAGENRTALQQVSDLAGPHKETLLDIYFAQVHPILPVLDEEAVRWALRDRLLDATLLATVYLISYKWLNSEQCHDHSLEPWRLAETASRLFDASLAHPQLSTVQAGLLLIQSSTETTHLASVQLTNIGYSLGLNQDCSQWNISSREQKLRKRLSWMLFAQDKWFSLLHGRPSYISASNWNVPQLSEEDFINPALPGARIPVSTDVVMQFMALTCVLSEILDTFYTLGAEAEAEAAGAQGLRIVLQKAKPVQIKLKDWFTRLPEHLKMDAANENSCGVGSLHLAYFATEITLHRCIIRATARHGHDPYLSYICRSAAKTRLISAMDFVNRLRPAHLRPFWPFAGFANFALIGTFGALLEATALAREEAEFYHLRLEEYQWTLSVNRHDATFLGYAMESLRTNLELLQRVPEKPASADVVGGMPSNEPVKGPPSPEQSGPYEFSPSNSMGGMISPSNSSMSNESV